MGSEPDPDLTRDLRRRPGGVPLITVLPKVEEVGRPQDLFGHVDQCRPLCLLPFHESPDLLDLRTLLGTRPSDLPGALVEYLSWRGLVLDTDLRRTIRRILELSGEVRTVSGLARGLYMSRRALGRRFLREGLPVPSHWLQFGRILRVGLDLQKPEATLMAVAFDHDFPDGFSLSNQMKRLLGLRPSEVSGRLGWEWLMERWIRAELATGGFRGDAVRLLGGNRRPDPPVAEVKSERQPA
jgi:AraC-like DNA-binding protein